jgi:trk system potassium uptake protein TrkA
MYVIITGINSLSKRLVSKLESKHDVVVIEEDEDRCERLYSSTGATVINKSPSTISALEDAGITEADVVIASEREDNENMVVCSLSRKYGVPKVVTRVQDDDYLDAFQMIGADPISHNDIIIEEFLSAVEHPHLVKLANLKGDREILKGSIRKNSGFEGKEVSELKEMSNFPSSFRVAALVREEEEFADPSDQSLNRDDELVLIGPEEGKKSLNRFFQNQ